MNVWKRALLYIKREKNKTIILLVLFLVMSSLVLTGLFIRRISSAEVKRLREKIGADFKVEGSSSHSVGDDVINAVMSDEGVLDYNGMNVSYIAVENLMLEPGHFAGSGEIWEKVPQFISNSKSERNPYFYNHEFDLVAGRHINPDDKGKIIISESLATYNGFELGDTITAFVEEVLGADNPEAIGQTINLEIVGIYKIKVRQSLPDDTPESSLPENFIFADTQTGQQIYQLLSGEQINSYRNGIIFYVKDPKKLDDIIARLEGREDINFKQYKVIKNNKTYEELANPIEKLGQIIGLMVLAIIMISMLLLSLILTLWIRNRIHEIGIYLSMGIGKLVIIKQLLIECLLIAFISLTISFVLFVICSAQLENTVLEKMTEVNRNQMEQIDEEVLEDSWEVENRDSVSIGLVEWIFVTVVEMVVIIVSVSTASVFIIRLKPKDILSEMS